MKGLIACFFLLILLGTGASTSVAQRRLSVEALVLDDNFGHTLTVQTPQPSDPGYTAWLAAGGTFTFKIPIPPTPGAISGFVAPGDSLTGTPLPLQLLRWDYPTSSGGTGGAQGAWKPTTPNAIGVITGPALGGTTSAIPKWGSATTLANSSITETTSNVLIGKGAKVSGNLYVSTALFDSGGTATFGDDVTPNAGVLVLHDAVVTNAKTVTIRTVDTLTSNQTFILPDHGGTLSVGGLEEGTINHSTLRWSQAKNRWVENKNVLSDDTAFTIATHSFIAEPGLSTSSAEVLPGSPTVMTAGQQESGQVIIVAGSNNTTRRGNSNLSRAVPISAGGQGGGVNSVLTNPTQVRGRITVPYTLTADQKYLFPDASGLVMLVDSASLLGVPTNSSVRWNGGVWQANQHVTETSGGLLTVDSGIVVTAGAIKTPLGAGIAHLTATGVFSSSLIADADISSVSGTKVVPDFGAQNVTTTGAISTAGSGSITSAGLLTASNGANVASGNLTVASGNLTVSSLNVSGVVHNSNAGLLSTGLIVNADVSASAAISGTKISPNFGAQAISTSGNISSTSGTITSAGLLTASNALTITAGAFTTPLGVGVAHITAGGVLASSTVVDVDVSASAAIAGSKINPNFAAQQITTTGGATLTGATNINQSGSAATIIGNASSATSISGTNWSVANTGVGSFASVASIGGVSVGGHITSSNSVGSISGAGGVTSATVSGTDIGGKLNFTVAASSAAGTATINFGTAYTMAPTVVVSPANAAAANSATGISSYFVTSTTSSFTVQVSSGTFGATGAVFNYIVVQ